MLKKALSIFLISCILGSFFIWPQNIFAASVLRINEAAPDEPSGRDWVEIYVSADGDYSNFVLRERNTTLKMFPSGFNLSGGDYIVIHINETGADEDNSTGNGANGYWDLYSSDSGLTGTDNVISIEDAAGNIIDALSYSNNDGTWASAQQDAFNNAINFGQWTGTLDGGALINEGESIDWSSGGSGNSLGRDDMSFDSDNTGIASDDWEIKSFQTMGSANKENLPPSILSVQAYPSSVPADGITSVSLVADVFDEDGLSDISSVFVDLAEISGDDLQEMYDDGTNGDLTSGDGIYCFETYVPASISADSYDFAVTASDSAGNEDSDVLTLDVVEPTYSNNIVISEVLPNPEGTESTDEYIELKNNGSETVNLENWKVGDSGTTYDISSDDYTSTEILPGGYFVVYRSESGIALNNTGGEEMFLYQPNDNLSDSVSFLESAPEGQSYNLMGVSWDWSIDLTPGSENIITHENHNPEAYAGSDIKIEVAEEVLFDGSDSSDPDGDGLSYSWDFDDGAMGVGVKVRHSYTEEGTYSVALSIDDGRGGEDTDTLKVVVSESLESESGSNQTLSGPFSDEIIINEILPNPEGSDTGGEGEGEFIELYNSGSSMVDLSGWQIDDEDGGSSPHTFEGVTIDSGQYLVLWRSDTGLALNNDADSVRLIQPDGNIISEVNYQESASDGVAYALDGDSSWKWTNTPTPGDANNISETEDGESNSSDSSSSGSSSESGDGDAGGDIRQVTIAEARGEEKNTKVKVVGIALVEPGLLGSKVFYIQDSTAGIQIYFSKEDFPEIKLGDEVAVSGKVSEAQSEKKINVSEKTGIEILGHKNTPDPQEMKTGELEEKYEGQLVQISGEIAKTSGNVFYVDDGSGQAKTYINKNTGIEKPKMAKGDKVTILGIASETSSGYRVLPRYQSDLKSGDGATLAGSALSSITNLPKTGGGVWFLFGFSFIASLYILIPKIAFMWG